MGNNIVTSSAEPRVRVELPKEAQYAGTDRWVLFGIANCELFAFVQADAQNRVHRLYWVQFEGYLPAYPKLQHTYTSTRHATLGGLDFYVDTWIERYGANGPQPPDTAALASAIRAKGYAVPPGIHTGSDDQHIYALIHAKGYTLPRQMSSVRFVHLLDDKRKELMIIYSEDLHAGNTIQHAKTAVHITP